MIEYDQAFNDGPGGKGEVNYRPLPTRREEPAYSN